MSAENTAITLRSPPRNRNDSMNSTTGAISEASMSTVSLTRETSTGCRATGLVSSVIVGCSAAAPHPPYNTAQPRSTTVPLWNVPWIWIRP